MPDPAVATLPNAPEILKRSERRLPVRLTGEEFVDRARMLATSQAAVNLLEEQKRANAASLNEAIKEGRAECARLAPIVRDNAEPRLVMCTTSADWERNVAITVRDDTGEVVEERALTPDERQRSLV